MGMDVAPDGFSVQRERQARRSPIAAIDGTACVLLIEDNPGDAELIRDMLEFGASEPYSVIHVSRIRDVERILHEEHVDAVLLDLSLPDTFGIETVRLLRTIADDLPIVVQTGVSDEQLALACIDAGAQDYLLKNELRPAMLRRTIRYAIERHKLQMQLHALSLRDDLTNLYNRRGFLTIAEQYLKLARRQDQATLIMFVDLDGLKRINDTLGHEIGSQMIIDAATVLQSIFRECDILARLGGDEFVALIVGVSIEEVDFLTMRLNSQVERHNQQGQRSYQLSMSVGFAQLDPTEERALERAMAEADQAMYAQKRAKRAGQDSYSQEQNK